MSLETIVGLSHHVLSDYIGGVAGIHYKANSLINLPVFAGGPCAYTILITSLSYTVRPICSCLGWILCFEILFLTDLSVEILAI